MVFHRGFFFNRAGAGSRRVKGSERTCIALDAPKRRLAVEERSTTRELEDLDFGLRLPANLQRRGER